YDLSVFHYQVPCDQQSYAATYRLRSNHHHASNYCCSVLDWCDLTHPKYSCGCPSVQSTKTFAILGLTLGFLLWQVGFMSIGGEWFGMWQSQQWNGVPSAFRFVLAISAVLILVAMPDHDLERQILP